MKQIIRLSLFFILVASGGSLWAQYGIGTNNPNASAALEIKSPDKGVLIPSLTLTSTSSFSPVTGTSSTSHDGMIVWNESSSTSNDLSGVGFYFWENHPSIAGQGYWYRLTTTGDEVLPVGTTTNSTLRWNGTEWVEATNFRNGTTTATLEANLTVTGTVDISDATTINGAMVVNNNATVTGTLAVTGNATVTGNTTASGTLTANSTTTLKAALVDSYGNTGTAGQILSSTGTSTQWIDEGVVNLATMTATGNVTATIRLLLIEPGGADVTVTLPDASALAVGHQLLIRRNQDYIATNDAIVLDGNGAQTIDGQLTRNMNVGYQSLTLVNIGSEWVSIQ